MRRVRYHSNYGYVVVDKAGMKGSGLTDVIKFVMNGFNKLPPAVLDAGKKAATNIATKGIIAAGDRIGSKLAEKIRPSKPKLELAKDKPILKAPNKEELAKDLKLLEPDQYGFGRSSNRTTGGGIKNLL